MNLRSKRFLLAVCAGAAVTLFFAHFLKQSTCGAVQGILIAALLARAVTPKDVAVIGAAVFFPLGLYVGFQEATLSDANPLIGMLASVPLYFLTGVWAAGIGALFGLVIGRLLQIAKERSVRA